MLSGKTFFRLARINSIIPGKIDMKMITTIVIEKLFFTKGMLPKKYPPNTNIKTQRTPPTIL